MIHPSRMGVPEVCAAVFCGANTAERLSREWSITHHLAASLLAGATEDGLLVRMSGGRFHASSPDDAAVAPGCPRIADPPARKARPRPHYHVPLPVRDAAGRFRAA